MYDTKTRMPVDRHHTTYNAVPVVHETCSVSKISYPRQKRMSLERVKVHVNENYIKICASNCRESRRNVECGNMNTSLISYTASSPWSTHHLLLFMPFDTFYLVIENSDLPLY